MIVTVITMYRAHDAEMFTQVVDGKLTDEQKDYWREAHKCDKYDTEPRDDCPNNMFFKEIEVIPNTDFKRCTADLMNVDGGCWVDSTDKPDPEA